MVELFSAVWISLEAFNAVEDALRTTLHSAIKCSKCRMAGRVSAKKQILFPAAVIVDTKRKENRRDALYKNTHFTLLKDSSLWNLYYCVFG